MTNDLKPRFDELSRAIQALHRDLLMLEAKKMAAQTGHELTPYELLNATLTDPALAWLRQLSSLIVTIDTLVDEAPHLSAQEANEVADQVGALLDQPARETPTVFWDRYTKYLGDYPDLILRHAKVKDLVAALKPRM